MALEIERKYIVNLLVPVEELVKRYNGRMYEISQVYLTSCYNLERRVRCMTDVTPNIIVNSEGHKVNRPSYDTKFYFTTKSGVSYGVRREEEVEICAEDYHSMANERDIRYGIVSKRRSVIPYSGKTLEIDQYRVGPRETILEVELKDIKNKVRLPDSISIVREVTGLPDWSNKAIAVRVAGRGWE